MPATDYSKLAKIYDLIVSSDEDISFFIEEAQKANGPVLELMAGTGRVSVPLAESGVALTCVDSSEEMLADLRRKNAEKRLGITVINQDVTDLKLSQNYNLIFIAFNSFLELAEREDQIKALSSIRSRLTPGGRFICTLQNPAVRLQTVGGRHVLRKSLIPPTDGEIVVTLETEFDEKRRVVDGKQTFEILDATGKPLDRLELPLRFVLLGEKEFREMIDEQGFKVEALFGDYARKEFDSQMSSYMIWLLRKPQRN